MKMQLFLGLRTLGPRSLAGRVCGGSLTQALRAWEPLSRARSFPSATLRHSLRMSHHSLVSPCGYSQQALPPGAPWAWAPGHGPLFLLSGLRTHRTFFMANKCQKWGRPQALSARWVGPRRLSHSPDSLGSPAQPFGSSIGPTDLFLKPHRQMLSCC